MRIERVEIFDLHPQGLDFAFHPVVVRIHTSEGISGVGEVGLAYGCGHSAGAGMLENLADLLLGKNPLETEKRWDEMMANTFWGHSPGPVMYGGISAMDIAMWDIRGKYYGEPVYKLLGGPVRTRIRAYASQVQFGWGAGPHLNLHHPDDLREVTRKMIDDGFDCVKINPIRYDKDGLFLPCLPEKVSASLARAMVERVRAVREEGGEDLDILVEFNCRASVAAAVQLGKMLEELSCMYLEEPVPFMAMENIRDVAAKIKIPLAGGERLYTRWQFLPYLQERLIGLAQPDVGLTGGITEMKKICDLAQIFDVGVQSHVCGGPVAVAASLHIAAAVTNYTLHEHHVRCLKPAIRDIVLEDFQPEGGSFALPDRPGIGVELNDDVVNRSPKRVKV